MNNDLRKNTEDKGFLFFAKTPVVYHCHHFNLFLDQTIDDALGHAEGEKLRMKAAREAAHQLISNVAAAMGAEMPAEKLEVAKNLFRHMGHGALEVLADEEGGEAFGNYLHYSFSWLEKYGKAVKRRHAVDAFAAGFASAMAEVAFGISRESMWASEKECYALKDPACKFALSPKMPESPPPAFVNQAAYLSQSHEIQGLHEAPVREIAEGLRNFTHGVTGDERGLVQAFGVFVTMHLPAYYNHISYEAEMMLAEKGENTLEIYRTLLRESGHVCVFNTFGGILLSPEFEGLVGRPTGDYEQLLTYCCAMGRALGFGNWAVKEFVADKRLVLVTPNSYESAHYLHRYGAAKQGNSYFIQGSALAIMVLLHKLDWKNPPQLSQKVYNDLFRGGLGWKVEEVQCLAMGHPVTEVVVTKDG